MAIKKVLHLLNLGKSAVDAVKSKAVLFGENFSWLRAKAYGECLMAHCDYYYYKVSAVCLRSFIGLWHCNCYCICRITQIC